MNEQQLKKLLQKYLSGNATKAEAFIVESWMESFQQDDDPMAGYDTLENHSTIADQIIAKTLNSNPAAAQTSEKHTVKLWKKVAAVAALLLAMLSIGFYFQHQHVDQKHSMLANTYDKYTTPIKAFKQLQLPDSTMVYLNSNSTLEVQHDFNKQSERRVKLTGEAFFDVKKDSKHPFKIQVGELQVKVLGTSFNINANAAQNKISVAVKTGKVNVSTKDNLLASLTANQVLTFHPQNKGFDVEANPDDAQALWRKGIVRLNQASFTELSATIYNIYGVKVQSENTEVLAERYNFTIRSSRTLEQTLNQLSKITAKNYRKEGNSIVIF